jgi:hypothetical protein
MRRHIAAIAGAILAMVLVVNLTTGRTEGFAPTAGGEGGIVGATPRGCPKEKIKTFFEAGAGRDAEAMWATFSPRQRHFDSKAQFLEWIASAYQREDAGLGERPQVRMTELKIKLIDANDELCSYAIYAVQETLTSKLRIVDRMQFVFYLDKDGIVQAEQRGRISTREDRGQGT